MPTVNTPLSQIQIADAFAKEVGFKLEINEAKYHPNLILSASASPVILLCDQLSRVSRSLQGFQNCVVIIPISDSGQVIVRQAADDTARELGVPVGRVFDALRSTLEGIRGTGGEAVGEKRPEDQAGRREGGRKRRKRSGKGRKWAHDRYEEKQRDARTYPPSPPIEPSPPPPYSSYSPKPSTSASADRPIRGLPIRPTSNREMGGTKADGGQEKAGAGAGAGTGSSLPARPPPTTSFPFHPLPPRPPTDFPSQLSADTRPRFASSGSMAIRAVMEAAAQRDGAGRKRAREMEGRTERTGTTGRD